MKKAQKRAWIRALRSGKYKQARESLATNRGFCCLGVLYDISADDYWVKVGRTWCTGADGEKWMLPDHLKEEWGLDSLDEDRLVKMNDRGVPFPVIANWIKDNIPEED